MDSYPVKSYNFNQQIGFNILFGLKTTEHRFTLNESFRRSSRYQEVKGRRLNHELTKSIDRSNLKPSGLIVST
jgi:hypothetical protein